MNLFSKFKTILINNFQNPVSNASGSMVQFINAQKIVRIYYFFLLYASVGLISQWDVSLASQATISTVWSTAWLSFVSFPTALYAIRLFFIGSSLSAAFYPEKRIARFAAWIGVLEYVSLYHSFLIIDVSWYAIVAVAFLLIFLPDNWSSERYSEEKAEKFLVIFWGCQAFILLTYSMAGIGKIIGAASQIARNEISVLHPQAIAFHVADRMFVAHQIGPFGPWIIDHYWLAWPVGIISLYFLLFSFPVAFRPSLHRLWGIALTLFHVANYLAMGIGFAAQLFLVSIFVTVSPFPRQNTPRGIITDLPLARWMVKTFSPQAFCALFANFKPFRVVGGVAILLIVLSYGLLRMPGVDDNTPVVLGCNPRMEMRAKAKCWADAFETILNYQGMDAAFEVLASAYNGDPDFSYICHDLTHKLGETAYQKFKAAEELNIPIAASFCHFGFYHGFIENLVQETKSPATARDFCKYIGARTGSRTKDAEFQCYHGIGHGNAGIHDQRFWGNEKEMSQRALSLCEQIAVTPEQRYRCAAGVFNGIANFYLKNEFGFSLEAIDPADPLRFCRQQSEEYRKPCYGNMSGIIRHITGNDLQGMIQTLKTVPLEDRPSATWYLAGLYMERRIQDVDFSNDVGICRRVQPELHLICIRGLAIGFLWYGKPGSEYRAAINFCKSGILTEEERLVCFDEILASRFGIRSMYSDEQAAAICKSIDPNYQRLCRDTTNTVL